MKNLLSFTLIVAVVLSACTPASRLIYKAEEAYVSENYSVSAEKCSEAYTKLTRRGNMAKKKKAEMAFKVAESYRHTEKIREANEWYERAISLDYFENEPLVYLYNGMMLQMMQDCEKAKKNYEEYLKLVPGDERATVGIQSCDNYKEFVAEKTRHIVENETTLNKKEFDMAPMFGDRKGVKVYFSSSRDGSTGDSDPRSGETYMDLWVSELDKKGEWTAPALVAGEGINTIDNEGTVSFDARYKVMFFTRCPNQKKHNLGCDIYWAEAKGKSEWAEPRKIEIKTNDTISVGHPCTMDGVYLIFASDMAGGFGGKDLWYTTYNKKEDKWSTPVNMGPEINTKGNEMFPTFALNGDLIFASDGMPGMGGLDLYRATRVGEENKWENAENMGYPINSTNNDYALIEQDERHGLFTSERKGPNGESVADIYSYELPPNLYNLRVNVSELGNKSKKIKDVKIVVKGSDGSTFEGISDSKGGYFWEKRPNETRFVNEEVDYTIMISKEGYHEDKKGSSFTTVGLTYGQEFVIDMALLPKTPIRLPEVRYPLDQWTLLVDSSINSPDSLLFVYNLLEEYPGMVLELSSHTDSRGSNERNQKLSENRAKACYKYLVEQKGVDPRRIVPVGKGENEPKKIYKRGEEFMVDRPEDMTGVEEVVLNEAFINKYKANRQVFEMLHQFNRRTEGRVLSMDFDPANAPAANPGLLEYIPYP